jgi:hypothetical protein
VGVVGNHCARPRCRNQRTARHAALGGTNVSRTVSRVRDDEAGGEGRPSVSRDPEFTAGTSHHSRSFGVNTVVGTLGLQADDQLMVPTSPHVVDWYVDGPTPGHVGSSVILGHVDSFKGPGTFFYLKKLKTGNAITVVLADGTAERFVVTRVVEYAKTSFPDRLVFGSQGTRSLNLVTCGGVFDHDTGHYESNVVVFSHLVSVVVAKGAASS